MLSRPVARSRMSQQFPPVPPSDPNSNQSPDPANQPHPNTGSGQPPKTPAALPVLTSPAFDANIRNMLLRLGVHDCSAKTSAAIAAYARRVSPEVFETLLDQLLEYLPAWQAVVSQKRTRVMPTYLDEFAWNTRSRCCPHATPEQLADHLGVGAVYDLAALLGTRLSPR